MFLSTPPRRRNLVLNRAKRVADYNRRRFFSAKALPLSLQTPLTSFENDDPSRADEPIAAGEELLFSFFRPSLQAGVYLAEISQNIVIDGNGPTDPTNELNLNSSKSFHVVGSRFALEEGDVAGFYPPQGHGDYNHILPHIIFNDQHLPWIRSGTNETETDTRNAVPWLVLLIFTDEELTIDPSEGILLEGKEQDSAGGVTMAFSEIFALQSANKIVSPFSESDPDTIDPETSAKFIFVPKVVFQSLFCTYNADGSPKGMNAGDTPDTSRYKYLAHCRKINTEGLPEILETESGQRLYSIVVSHRTAPVDFLETTGVSVHLVSIENIEIVKNIADGQRVAMCSLHSWTYNVFAAGTPTLQERLRYLGDTLNVLRPSQTVIDSLGDGTTMPADVIARLKARAEAGYTIVRYRVSTGDETMAFTRSPFVPGHVVYPIPNLPSQSLTSGTDLQILDQHLGIMDITYSSAWQLGKSLAMADRSFTAALVRIRTQVGAEALKRARLELTKQHGQYSTLDETIANLADSLKLVYALPKKASLSIAQTAASDAPRRRWYRPAKDLLDLSITNPKISSRLERHCCDAISTFSVSTDGAMFAEYNTPLSSDWQQVFSFLLDRLYLYSIPPHYLLPDPAILPEESMRFFVIDENWTDALIDGALSIANHQLPQMDMATRKAIRAELRKYLNTVDPMLKYKPQVPKYGMLLRSEIVSQFPSLTIRAPNPNADDLRAPILRQTVIADGTLLVLFDRVPGSQEFQSLTIQMPPHEQRFSIGSDIDVSELKIQWKRIYTSGAPESSYRELWTSRYKPFPDEGDETLENIAVYDWKSRTLNMHTYTGTALRYLQEKMESGKFDEDAQTSLIAAIQLNDPLYEMSIGMDPRRRRLLSLAETYSPIDMGFGPQSKILMAFGPQSKILSLKNSAVLQYDAQYVYGMWPVFQIPKERPSDNRYPLPNDLSYGVDIVFSLVRRDDYQRDIKLVRIEIDISLNADIAFMEDYDGPGGYMASNMRWTYAQFEHQPNELLRIGMLPRDSTNGWSPIVDNKELTFVLRGCRLRAREVGWYVTVNEYFEGQVQAAGGPILYKLVPSHQMPGFGKAKKYRR